MMPWRHTPRRLDAEEIRDAMLATACTLNPNRSAGSPARTLKMIEMRDNGPEARTLHELADASRYRSIYLPLLRGVTPRALEVFDPVEQTLVTGRRDVTTVPSQALYLLNSSFVRRQALAERRHPRAEPGVWLVPAEQRSQLEAGCPKQPHCAGSVACRVAGGDPLHEPRKIVRTAGCRQRPDVLELEVSRELVDSPVPRRVDRVREPHLRTSVIAVACA